MLDNDLLKLITNQSDSVNKKMMLCICAAITFNNVQNVDQSIEIAQKIIDKVYV